MHCTVNLFLIDFLDFHILKLSLLFWLTFLWLFFGFYHQLQVKSNAPRPNQRKKWRKSTVQLVTNAPPPSQPEVAEAPQRPDNRGHEASIPMKLPRAMRSAASNGSNPFRERNADKADQSGVNKEGGIPTPRSPLWQNRTSDEKENCGL